MLPASTRSAACLPRYVVSSVRVSRCVVRSMIDERERRHDPGEQFDLRVGEAVRRVGRPRRDHALGLAEPDGFADAHDEGQVVGDALILELVEHRELAPAIRRIEAPAQRGLAAAQQEAERALREVHGDDGALVVASERLLDTSFVAKPAHAAAVERRIEQVGGHRDPHHRDAGRIQPLADAGKDFDLVGAGQRRADDPLADLVASTRSSIRSGRIVLQASRGPCAARRRRSRSRCRSALR